MEFLQRWFAWLVPSRARPGYGTHGRRFQPRGEALEGRELLTAGTGSLMHFDFGTGNSPVAAGYVNVPFVAYNSSQGYGWSSTQNMSAADHGGTDPLTRDFHRGTDGTFLVDLPNGTYNVTVTLGDTRYAHDNMVIWAEGIQEASGLATSVGQAIRPKFQVQVKDGQLTLRIADAGGASPFFAIDGLDITPVTTATPATTTTTTTGVYPPVHGVFLLGRPDYAANLSILSQSNVDGLAIRASWDKIETASGVYNWSFLDSQIAAAQARGKEVSLSITAGTCTPSWVYTAGAQRFNFTLAGTAKTIPVPWDPVFLREWEKFITALGARYGGNSAVVQVKATGINTTTPEFMLPHTATDTTHWQQIGYTRTKVENAWLSIADTWAKAFPKSRISFIVVPNGCPKIDNNGHIFSGTSSGDWQIYTDLINAGITRYANQFAVENHGLSDFWCSGQVNSVAGKTTTGYQMIWWATGDTTYRMNQGTAGSAYTILQMAVNKGISAGAHYLEIYSKDIANSALQPIISLAHNTLKT